VRERSEAWIFNAKKESKKYPFVHPVGFRTDTCAFREFPGEYGGVPVSFRQETVQILCDSGDGKW
jgi:hypothetical protein